MFALYFTGKPKQVVGKRVPSINRKGESDDDEDDHDDGSHSEDKDSDNGDVSMVESLNDRKQATAETTTFSTPKGVTAKRDACVSVSTSKSRKRAVHCASKKNEVLSTTSRGMQSNLPPSESDRENHSANISDLPSSAWNLPKCQIKIKKLPICSKHGRNWKVVQYKTRHDINTRHQHGDVVCNRGSEDNGEHSRVKESDSAVLQKEVHPSTIKNQRIQKTKNTRTKDYYTYIHGDIDSGAELMNDKRRKLVNSLSGTVKNHLDSKHGINNRFPRRAEIRRRSYVETLAQESSSDEHDDHGELLTRNRENSHGVKRGLRQSSQPLLEDATTKNANDNDGDNDEDDEESDEVTPHKHKTRLTVAEVYGDEGRDEEDHVIPSPASETAMSELDIQKGVGCKEKGEISWKGKEIPTRGTNSTEESRTQNIDKQIEKQVSSEKDMGSPPRQRRSPKKDLLSKKNLSPSKSKGAVEPSKQKTDDTIEHETGDNSGERQLCRAMDETSRLSTVRMKDKSPSKRPVNIELSKGKYCAVGVDEASGTVVEESRESVIDNNAESVGNTNDRASEDETCQEREANDISQTDEETEGEF